MQQVFVIYDIENDGVRAKIANACQDYGLDRVQFSAFAGRLSRNKQEELMLRVGDLLGNRVGDIQLIPVCEADWKKRLEVSCARQ